MEVRFHMPLFVCVLGKGINYERRSKDWKIIIKDAEELKVKTIQEVLKELDKEEVIDCYFSTYPINIFKDLDQEWDDMTVAECKTYSRDKIKALIDRVISAKGNLSADKKSILFAYKYAEDAISDEIGVGLVDAGELLDAEDVSKVHTYAYEFERIEDTVDYYVADTPLTRNNLLEVAVSYLFEISFFGYEQEHLEEEKQKLEHAIEESKDPSKCSSLISYEELLEHFGITEDEAYPEEEAKRKAFEDAVLEYDNYCSVMEMERVKAALLADTDELYSGR